jgi:hypothetical protein
VIQLPAQQVVVETAQPHVIVQETKLAKHAKAVRVDAAAPFVATFFTPVLPQPSTAPTSADSASLSLAHQMEASLLQLEKVRAANAAEIEATQRVFDRISRSLQTGAGPGATAATASQLQELNTRLDRLERLVLLHSDVLKQIAPPPPKPMGQAGETNK